MKLAVIGGRDFANKELFLRTMAKFTPTTIVSGGAAGADTMAADYALEKGIDLIVYYADWTKYGKSAGPIRNAQIIDAADAVVAFWDGKSPGTKNAISKAQKKGIAVHVEAY